MPSEQKSLPVLLTSAKTAELLRVTERTLDNWRERGFGPRYIRLGRQRHHKVVYDLRAIEEWILQQQR